MADTHTNYRTRDAVLTEHDARLPGGTGSLARIRRFRRSRRTQATRLPTLTGFRVTPPV